MCCCIVINVLSNMMGLMIGLSCNPISESISECIYINTNIYVSCFRVSKISLTVLVYRYLLVRCPLEECLTISMSDTGICRYMTGLLCNPISEGVYRRVNTNIHVSRFHELKISITILVYRYFLICCPLEECLCNESFMMERHLRRLVYPSWPAGRRLAALFSSLLFSAESTHSHSPLLHRLCVFPCRCRASLGGFSFSRSHPFPCFWQGLNEFGFARQESLSQRISQDIVTNIFTDRAGPWD